jgi:hypothetical protein
MAKACPLLSTEKDNWECMTDSCAWYVNCKCAIVVIAENTIKIKENGEPLKLME